MKLWQFLIIKKGDSWMEERVFYPELESEEAFREFYERNAFDEKPEGKL